MAANKDIAAMPSSPSRRTIALIFTGLLPLDLNFDNCAMVILYFVLLRTVRSSMNESDRQEYNALNDASLP